MSTPTNKSTEKEVSGIDLIKDESVLTRVPKSSETSESGEEVSNLNFFKGRRLIADLPDSRSFTTLLKNKVYDYLKLNVIYYNKFKAGGVDTSTNNKKISLEELKTKLDRFVFGSDVFIEYYNSMVYMFGFDKTYEDIYVLAFQSEFELYESADATEILKKLFKQIDEEVHSFNEEDRFSGYELDDTKLKLFLLEEYKGGKRLEDTYSYLEKRFEFKKSFTDISNMPLHGEMNVAVEGGKTKSPERTLDDVFSSFSFAEREKLTLVVELVILRRKAGLSVKDLAKKSGVSKKYIKGLEGSTKKFKVKKVIKLANALGMQLKFVKR